MASGKTKKKEIIIKLDKKVFDRVFKVIDFFLLIFFLTISCSKNQVKVKLDDACKFQDEKKEILICDEEKIWKITRKRHPKFFKNCQEIQYHTFKNRKKYKEFSLKDIFCRNSF